MEDSAVKEICGEGSWEFSVLFSTLCESKIVQKNLKNYFWVSEIGTLCLWVPRKLYMCHNILKLIYSVLLACGVLSCLNLLVVLNI